VRITEAITDFEWAVLLRPLCSADLTPSKHHLFDSLKDSLQGHQYVNDKALQNATPVAAGGSAMFTGWEYMLLFEGIRRLWEKMATTLKNNYAFINVMVKF
jgi:hypothetical protein